MNFLALIGEGRGIVSIGYSFYHDEDICIDTVTFNGQEVMDILTDTQLDDIRFQYQKHMANEAKEIQIDIGESQYQERMAA
jgi:hypothetical protein